MVAHWGHTDSGNVVAQPVQAQGLETNRLLLVLVLGVSAAGVIGIAILVAYFAGGRVCAGAVGLLLVLAWVAKFVLRVCPGTSCGIA